MTYTGPYIQYLLKNRGYSFSDVARELGVSPQMVYQVAYGLATSGKVLAKIEETIGLRHGSLTISRKKYRVVAEVA